MCPTNTEYGTPESGPPPEDYDWRQEAINGGSLRHVDLHTGSNGWASPPGDLFVLRDRNYFSRRQKSPSGDWLLKPAGVDWLRSPSRLDNVLARPDNRVAAALRRTHELGRSRKAFLLAVNLQIPGREWHSVVFYFATEDPIPTGSLLHRFVHGDDAFRNARFKVVNRVVKGPWIIKAAVGNYAACLLSKALTSTYHRGENYLEVDVDIGSSAVASAIMRLALGCVTALTIDIGFVLEAQAEEELPERLLGAVRVAQMEMSAATFVETRGKAAAVADVGRNGFQGPAKVNHHNQSPAHRHQSSTSGFSPPSSISSSSSAVDVPTPFCSCGLNAKLRTSWTARNPGRRFFNCARHTCKFSMWVDDELADRVMHPINCFMAKNVEHEQTIAEQRQHVMKLEMEQQNLVEKTLKLEMKNAEPKRRLRMLKEKKTCGLHYVPCFYFVLGMLFVIVIKIMISS